MKAQQLYQTVLEDLDWLWEEWWHREPDQLSEGHLRRGSAALRLLLVEGLLGNAWRHYGFDKEPTVIAPDIEALAKHHGLRLNLAASCIAGGGRQNGIDLSFVGAFRVDNPSTGVPADAEEGFAVCTTSVVREVSATPDPSEIDAMIEKRWSISQYLKSASAVRKGSVISRKEVIEYFRNYAGGAHHDMLQGGKKSKKKRYEFISELSGRISADVRDGLYFELLSIGQALARSQDIGQLRVAMRHQGG